MKRKTNIVGCLVLFTVFLMLLVSNAHAFLITSEISSFNIELVPNSPDSNMSLEWESPLLKYTELHAGQKTGDRTYEKDASMWRFGENSSGTIEAITEHSSITGNISDNNASIHVNFSEDTSDYMHCDGFWSLEGSFRIHGEGRVLISAVHHTDFENDISSSLTGSSSARLSLRNDIRDHNESEHLYENRHDENPSVFTDDLEVDLYFNDGDIGYLNAALVYNFRTNTESVPIPAAVWLFSTGLLCLGALRRGRK